MNNELIVDVSSSEISIALLQNKKIKELNKGNEQFSVADVYLGRVRKLVPALNAAFVDIGHEKDAFIHYFDLGLNFGSLNNFVVKKTSGERISFSKMKLEEPLGKEGKIDDYLKQGQAIMVQIVKEAISTKGPRLTSEISIAGRNIILIPFSDKISISKKIKSLDEKKRLKKIIKDLIPVNFGVIMRTACEGIKAKVIEEELESLIKRWEECSNKLHAFKQPVMLMREISRASAMLRDILDGTFNNIFVNNKTVYEELKEYIASIAPEKEKILKLYKGKSPIFDQFGVTKQIQGLFGRVVSLRSGAYLIIEHTEALHVIDVNSGIRMKSGGDQEVHAMEVNLLAAEEIARQLRVRDMGGIIIIDFIDLHNNENKQKLFAIMGELMGEDRAKHNILPLTKFGLMQITRQRVRPETHISTKEECPACRGTGHVRPSIIFDSQIKNQLGYLAEDKRHKYLKLIVHPYVAAYLTKGLFSLRRKWSLKFKSKIKIESDSSYNYLDFCIKDRYGNKLNE